MVCAEKIRLRDEYSATVRCLRTALKNLGTKTGDELVKGLAASKSRAGRMRQSTPRS
jgi:hypothetical protein